MRTVNKYSAKYLTWVVILLLNFNIKAGELDSLLFWSAKNHPELKSAYFAYEASLQKVHGSGFLPEPMVSFGYFISSPETRVGPQIGSVGFQQMFPWRGTLKAQKSMAVAQSKMKFEKFQLLKLQLFQEVRELYFLAEKMKVNVGLLSENIELLAQIKTIGLSKVEAGTGSTTDILRLNLKINELETKANTLDINYQGVLNKLKLIVDTNQLSLSFQDEYKILAEHVDSSSFSNHPMVKFSEEKLLMNKAQKKVINQKALPKFAIGANYIFVGERTDMNPADNGKDIVMPKLSLSLPIYRKKYKSLAKMNALEKESIEEEIKSKELTLNSKLVMIQAQISSAKERLKLYKKQKETALSILSVLKSDYENGAAMIESIFTTQAQLVMYQMEEQIALTDLKVAESKLAFILNKDI